MSPRSPAAVPRGYEPRANSFMHHSLGEWLFQPKATWKDHQRRKKNELAKQETKSLEEAIVFTVEDKEAMKERIRNVVSDMQKCQRCHGKGSIGPAVSCPNCHGTGKVEATQAWNVHDLYHECGVCQAIARSQQFEYLTYGVIGFNAIWIAYDADYNQADILIQAPIGFQIVEYLTWAFFLFEWLVRFFSFRRKLDGLQDGWFIFDSALVLLMFAELGVIGVLAATGNLNVSSGLGDATVLRMARLLRLTRMTRVSKLVKLAPELITMIKGMLAAVRSMVMALALLVIVEYIFAIVFVQLLKNTPIGNDMFPRVAPAMLTLFVHGTLLDDVGEILWRVGSEGSHLAGAFLIVYILISAMVVVNLLIGVLCEIVSKVTKEEDEIRRIEAVYSKLFNIFQLLDKNKDDLVSKGEFQRILETKDAAQALQDVGVDPVSLVDFVDAIFHVDSFGTHKPTLTFDEFMDEVLSYRGANTATVKDVVDLRQRLTEICDKVTMLLVDNGRGYRYQATSLPATDNSSDVHASPRDNAQRRRPGSSFSSSTREAPRSLSTASELTVPSTTSGIDGLGLKVSLPWRSSSEDARSGVRLGSWRKSLSPRKKSTSEPKFYIPDERRLKTPDRAEAHQVAAAAVKI